LYTTSLTLFAKLRDPTDAAAWDRFVDLYLPLLFFWARKLPIRGADPADFVQDIFIKLKRELPTFTYDRTKGTFRSWLRTLCVNHWRDYQRKRASHLAQADDSQLAGLAMEDDALEVFRDQDYFAFLAREAFKVLASEFDPITRAAFIEVVMKARSVNEVAQELGVTPNAISMRKFRVVRRLRQELAEFLE
jgi:RNA polymerase sigma-70 factor (ECF subfamily)